MELTQNVQSDRAIVHFHFGCCLVFDYWRRSSVIFGVFLMRFSFWLVMIKVGVIFTLIVFLVYWVQGLILVGVILGLDFWSFRGETSRLLVRF